MKQVITLATLLFAFAAVAQPVKDKLNTQVKQLLADSQMKHALLGIYVADAKTGALVYHWNGSVGLAPASTQKVVTSVAAFEILGSDYIYVTEMGYTGTLGDGKVDGDLVVKGHGDPTFGSARYSATDADAVFTTIIDILKRSDIKTIAGNVVMDVSAFSYQPVPGGWIWDDLGNYYGAGSWAINWRENQYDLLLKPGNRQGDPVKIIGTSPELFAFDPVNLLQTGKKGSGDNAYIYNPPYGDNAFVEGTIEGRNKISGAIPNGPRQFAFELEKRLKANNIHLAGSAKVIYQPPAVSPAVLYSHYSPSIDSIVYWFMKRSINLYGEALIKTIGAAKSGVGSSDSGLAVVQRFFNDKPIATSAALRIIDGSGLSPSNRITAEALVNVLVYARQQDWYPLFLRSFPEFNGMKLKSGTLKGVKSFTGYHTSPNGKEYAVAIVVNNYDGSTAAIVNKMYRVLNALK